MPSLFNEHEIKQAFTRLHAAKSPDDISAADAKVLHDVCDRIIKADERLHSREALRNKKMQAASANPAMRPILGQMLATLKRLNLELEDANDRTKLDAAFAAARWSTEERMRLKAMLHETGVID
jgi:hypothetical protein